MDCAAHFFIMRGCRSKSLISEMTPVAVPRYHSAFFLVVLFLLVHSWFSRNSIFLHIWKILVTSIKNIHPLAYLPRFFAFMNSCPPPNKNKQNSKHSCPPKIAQACPSLSKTPPIFREYIPLIKFAKIHQKILKTNILSWGVAFKWNCQQIQERSYLPDKREKHRKTIVFWK